jgi:hypothetical protein
MTGDEPEGFLGRWSRVKRTAARPVAEPEPEPGPEASGAADPGPADGTPQVADAAPETLSEEELAALPRIEDLLPGSDIRPFLRAGVPSALRNSAMRRMWMLTPGIRDYNDPAVDYAWDWNTPGGVPGDGMAPTPERAAQMLKTLLGPREQPGQAEAADVERDAPPDLAGDADPEASEDLPGTPPDLVEDSAVAGPSATVAEATEGPKRRRARVLRAFHRCRARRIAALRQLLPDRFPERTSAGGPARRSAALWASRAPRAGTSPRITSR